MRDVLYAGTGPGWARLAYLVAAGGLALAVGAFAVPAHAGRAGGGAVSRSAPGEIVLEHASRSFSRARRPRAHAQGGDPAPRARGGPPPVHALRDVTLRVEPRRDGGPRRPQRRRASPRRCGCSPGSSRCDAGAVRVRRARGHAAGARRRLRARLLRPREHRAQRARCTASPAPTSLRADGRRSSPSRELGDFIDVPVKTYSSRHVRAPGLRDRRAPRRRRAAHRRGAGGGRRGLPAQVRAAHRRAGRRRRRRSCSSPTTRR